MDLPSVKAAQRVVMTGGKVEQVRGTMAARLRMAGGIGHSKVLISSYL